MSEQRVAQSDSGPEQIRTPDKLEQSVWFGP